jgi:hypothetical protein
MRPSYFFGVMSSVGGVPVRGVCVVGGLLVLPGVVVFAGFFVMLSSMCGVFCCLVVLACFLGHGVFPLFGCPLAGLTPTGKQRNSRVSEAFLYSGFSHFRSLVFLSFLLTSSIP